MRKRALFFSCEPGGAEVLIPVIELLARQPDWEAVVCTYGLAARRFTDRGVAHTIIPPVGADDSSLLDTCHPHLLITSAASLPQWDMSEKHLWRHASSAGVPSMAFLDQWQNYAVRFSGTQGQHLAFQPDYINCINATGRAEMLRAGFEEARLVEFGHPYLSSLRERARKVDRAQIAGRLSLGHGEQVALFVSEAIREHYGNVRGYDQYDALRLFLSILSRSAGKFRPLIKLHPKDALAGYEEVLKDYAALAPIVVQDGVSPVECVSIADIVFGMSSVMLIEAYVLGKKVVALQPGLRVEDPMVLSRMGCIPCIVKSDAAVSMDELAGFKARDADFDYAFREREFLDWIAGELQGG